MNEDYGDMPIEDFTHGLYKNIVIIRWCLVFIATIEILRFVT